MTSATQSQYIAVAHDHGMVAYALQDGSGIVVEIPFTHINNGPGVDTVHVHTARQLRDALGY